GCWSVTGVQTCALPISAFVGPTNSVPANHWVYHVAAGQLQEGSNFLTAAVWFQDRATPAVTGRGDFSLPLQVVLDTTPPAPPPRSEERRVGKEGSVAGR